MAPSGLLNRFDPVYSRPLSRSRGGFRQLDLPRRLRNDAIMGPGTMVDARSWREELLLRLTHWCAVIGGVIAVGVIVRALAYDFVDIFHPAFSAMLIGYCAIVALRLAPRLPYAAR